MAVVAEAGQAKRKLAKVEATLNTRSVFVCLCMSVSVCASDGNKTGDKLHSTKRLTLTIPTHPY